MSYKISDLEKVVKEAGLEMEAGNNFPNVIAQIWWPYRNSGMIIDGKIYDNQTLTMEDVQNNHKAFNKVAEFLVFDADIQIETYHYVEFNFISTMVVHLRNDRDKLLTKAEEKTDWELDKTLETIPKPKKPDMTAGYHPHDMFTDTLKKHEKEKVLDGIVDLLSYHNVHGRSMILSNLARYSSFTEPLEKILDNQLLDVSFMIEQTLEDDWPYYENQTQAKKLFQLLSTYTTTMQLDLSNGRGFLPDVILESPKIIKQVSLNWKFIEKTEVRTFAMMIQDEQFKAVKIFMENYTPFDTASWFDDIVDPFLTSVSDKKQVKLFLDNWVELNNCYADFIDSLDTFVVRMSPENLLLAIKKVLGPNPQNLYNKIVDAFKNSNLFSEKESAAPILKLFIDNPEVDLTYGDAYIINVFSDDNTTKEKLLEISGMIDAVIANGDTSLLPDSVQDIFVF